MRSEKEIRKQISATEKENLISALSKDVRLMHEGRIQALKWVLKVGAWRMSETFCKCGRSSRLDAQKNFRCVACRDYVSLCDCVVI